MDKQTLIDLYIKRQKQRNKNHWQNRGNDLFKEATDKRCLRYYQRPNWVTDKFAEAIDFINSIPTSEFADFQSDVEKEYWAVQSAEFKKQREARQKREAKKEEASEKWKTILKPGDIIVVKQSGNPRAMIVMELDELNITGRYLDPVWDRAYGGYIKNTFKKTPYMAEKKYKFIVQKLENAIIQ